MTQARTNPEEGSHHVLMQLVKTHSIPNTKKFLHQFRAIL